jgi:hypothetical protein
MRAAGMFPIMTVIEPLIIVSGGPTQVAISPTRAAGRKPINTVGQPGGNIGPPTWGTTPVTIGHVCISVILAAGGISNSPIIRHYLSELWQLYQKHVSLTSAFPELFLHHSPTSVPNVCL